MVVRQFPEAHFLIVGDGPRKTSLMHLAQELGLDKHAHFLGFRRDMGDVLRAVDLNVLASKPEQETLSVAVIEGHGHRNSHHQFGCRLHARDCRSRKTGYLVRVGDHQELARRIMELLADPEMRRSMAKAAQALAFERLTVKRMTASFERKAVWQALCLILSCRRLLPCLRVNGVSGNNPAPLTASAQTIKQTQNQKRFVRVSPPFFVWLHWLSKQG